MARRKTTAGDLGCLAAIILIGVFAVLGPFALACWCIFAELRALAHRGAASVHDVLSDQEKLELNAAESRVRQLEAEYSQTLQRGVSLGFAQRQDGLFDARRPQARAMNAVLERLRLQHEHASARNDEVLSRLGGRMTAWLNARSGLIGARAALVTFVVCFVGFVAVGGGPLDLHSLMFGGAAADGSRLGASFGAMSVAVVVLLIVQATVKKSLAS